MDKNAFAQFWEKTPKDSFYYQNKSAVKSIWDALKPETQQDYISYCIDNKDMLEKEAGDVFSALSRMMLKLEY